MGFNLGAFTQGLTHGINSGMSLAERAKGFQRQNAIEEAAQNGLDAAKSAREADIGKEVNYIAAEPEAGATPTYRVGEQFYTSQGAARAAAEKNVAGFDSYFAKNAVPFMRDAYLQQGDVTKAQEWVKYGESQTGKDALSTMGRFMRAYLSGDHDGAVKWGSQYYNRFIDDGVNANGGEVVKGEDGKVLGYKFKLTGKDGKEFEQTVTPEDMLNGAMEYAPDKLFERLQGEYAAGMARKIKRDDKAYESNLGAQKQIDIDNAKTRNEVLKDRYALRNTMDLEKYKNNLGMDRDEFKSGLDVQEKASGVTAQADAVKRWALANGMTADEFSKHVPAVLRIANDQLYAKQSTPEEKRHLIRQKLIESDAINKNTSLKDGRDLVEKFYQMGEAAQGNSPSPAQPGLPAKPSAAASAPAWRNGLWFPSKN